MTSGGPRYKDDNDDARLTALEAEAEVLELIAESDGLGCTINQGANAMGMTYCQFYDLSRRLEVMGKIRIVRGAENYLRLVGANDPRLDECRLHTPWQEKALAFLSAKADERGLVHASLKEISRGIGHPGQCAGSITALECRGFLEILHRGGPTRPRLYRVFKNGNGPKGYSKIWFNGRPGNVPLYMLFDKEKEEDNGDAS